MNVKVHNLVTRVNETKSLVRHELPKCKCVLSESVCNSNQKWSLSKCRCVSVKNWMIGFHVKMVICGIVVRVIVRLIRYAKLMNI